MNIFQSLWLYWKGSTLPFIEVFIQSSSQRSAWNFQVLRTMASWCWWCSSTLWATAAMFSVDLTGRARERVALSNKDPVCRIRFTNWSTNCIEGISFLLNFPRKFLFCLGWRLTTLEVSFQYFPILFKHIATHFINVKQKLPTYLFVKIFFLYILLILLFFFIIVHLLILFWQTISLHRRFTNFWRLESSWGQLLI